MGTNKNPQRHITVLQRKMLRIMSLALFNSHSSSYFHEYSIFKFCDIINIEACDLLKDLNFYQNLMLTTLDHPVKAYFLLQVKILQDLEENQ